MSTTIPPTESSQPTPTNSSVEIIVALLNEAASTSSSTPKHWNAKRLYPFWRPCPICGKPFSVMNSDEYHKEHHCSRACAIEAGRRKRLGKRGPQKNPNPNHRNRSPGRVITCPVCGKQVYKPMAWLRKAKIPTCSRQCNGTLRGQEFAKHGHKGRAAWTDAGRASYREKMSGANNPAWKGGVTYFRKHGNYPPTKYVRCPAEFLLMARKDGYVTEHRLFVAQALGRCLKRSEVVHHVNHDPTDNRLENLALFASNTAHKRHEATGKPDPLWQL